MYTVGKRYDSSSGLRARPFCSQRLRCRPGSAETHLGSFLKPSWGSAFPGELPLGHICPWGVGSPRDASSPCITSQSRAALASAARRSQPFQLCWTGLVLDFTNRQIAPFSRLAVAGASAKRDARMPAATLATGRCRARFACQPPDTPDNLPEETVPCSTV